jgi:hypothetical protein
MNFAGSMEGQEIQVELKYCERCGGLWLRPQGTDGVYCNSCQLRLEARPDPGEAPPTCKSAPPSPAPGTDSRIPKGRTCKMQARIECLQGVAVMAVRA